MIEDIIYLLMTFYFVDCKGYLSNKQYKKNKTHKT